MFKSHTSEYKSWRGMIARCSGKGNTKYWADKGVSICEEWRDFDNFLMDMGKKPSEKHSIDRIDNDGNYEKSNCRWATQDIQVQNSTLLRTTNTSGYRGVHFNKALNNWRSVICVNYKLIHLGSYDSPKEAAMARDMYIAGYNLNHTRNMVSYGV